MKKKTKKPKQIKSQLPLHLTVRGSNYEFSVDATASRIMHDLQAIKNIMDSLNRTLSGLPGAISMVPQQETSDEFPTIKASKSTIDNIQSLFETPWGQKPRTAGDVLKALEANAVPDTTTAIAVCLLRLVKKHVLRRTQKAGKWQYYKLPS